MANKTKVVRKAISLDLETLELAEEMAREGYVVSGLSAICRQAIRALYRETVGPIQDRRPTVVRRTGATRKDVQRQKG